MTRNRLTQAALAALLATFLTAQSQTAPAPTPSPMMKPTNLQVLPRDYTIEQVMDTMEQWEGSLGARCSTCHMPDPKSPPGPNGKPRLNFPDDSKQEKKTARLMYLMTQQINQQYISKVPDMEQSVSCATCHRGHIKPQSFTPDEREEHEEHNHPAGTPEPVQPPASK